MKIEKELFIYCTLLLAVVSIIAACVARTFFANKITEIENGSYNIIEIEKNLNDIETIEMVIENEFGNREFIKITLPFNYMKNQSSLELLKLIKGDAVIIKDGEITRK